MTQEQLGEYVERLLPSFRKRYIKSADDEDLCQLALLDLFRKHTILDPENDKEFMQIFLSFFGAWQFHKRSTVAKAIKVGNYLGPFMGDRQGHSPLEHEFNPWNSIQTEALEYLELVTDPYIKGLLYDYYVLGYTLVEIGQAKGLSKSRIDQLLREGIKEIQRFIT